MKIAFIGCGGIARLHAASLRDVAPGDLSFYVASRTAERARQAAREIAQVTRRPVTALHPYAAALAAPEIDAVYIMTPHDQHIALAAEAVRCGKHVYLEKPVARTVAEAQPLARAMAGNPRVVVMIGENFRFVPALVQAAGQLRAGAIGRLHSLLAHGLFHVNPTGWRANRAAMGGGALIDGGVHLLHALRWLGGEVTAVSAMAPAERRGVMEGEEAIQLLLRFASGATATANFSWAPHGDPPLPDVVLLGTAGSLAVRMREKHNDLYLPNGLKPRKLRTGRRFGRDSLVERLGFLGAAREFLDCIATGRRPVVDLTEGLRDVAIVEAAYRALISRREEPVEPQGEFGISDFGFGISKNADNRKPFPTTDY